MADILELFSNRTIQAYVQAREYPLTLGDTLFPSVKTDEFSIEYILGANGAPVSASIHGDESETQIASREGLRTIVQDMALIKRKIPMRERLILALSQASNNAQIEQLKNTYFNDVDNMVNAVLTRVEAMRFEVLFDGQLNINENNFKAKLDYKVPAANKITLAAADQWSDDSSDPIEQLRTWAEQVAEATGALPTRVLTSAKVLNTLLAHPKVRTALFGSQSDRLLTRVELNQALQAMELPQIAVDRRTYRVQKNDGTYITKRYVPENKLVMMPDGAMGNAFFGVTAEEIELRNEADVQFQNFGNVIACLYKEPDPVTVWTKAVARALPSFPAANQVIQAEVL